MRGTLFMLTAICISTAFGCPAPSRATAIPTTCLMNVSVTARKKEGSGYASFQRQRRSRSWPTRNSSNTKDSQSVMKRTTVSSFGIFHFRQMLKSLVSRSVQSILVLKRVATSCTIQANVPSTGSMYRSLKPSPRKRVFRSKPSIYRTRRRRKTLRHP